MSLEVAIVVVDADPGWAAAVAALLRGAGFEDVQTAEPADLAGAAPSSVIVVSAQQAVELLPGLRANPEARQRCIVAVCESESQELACLVLGADALIDPSVSPELVRARVHSAQRVAERGRNIAELEGFQSSLLEMRALVKERGDGADVLREVLLMAMRDLNFERASMMAHIDGSAAAYVIAATDDPTLSKFEVAIADYPEVREAIHSGEALLVGDVSKHPATAAIAEDLQGRGVAALAVFPVAWKGRSMGALLFRKSTTGIDALTDNAQVFASLLAAQLAAQLRDSSLFDKLRDQTRRITRATFEAERRQHVIDSLSEYFEASTEGIFAIDQRGVVIHVNRSAEALTGFAQDALLGSEFCELVPKEQHAIIDQVVDAVFDGVNVEPVDVEIKNTGGDYTTMSLSTSTVLTKHGAVLLSFRDVTQQRALEAQLQHSNHFLTNLIDSAVDAIIAVDMRGTVIVFNKGAETLFGYTASEVVGKLSVTKLYPDGVPGQVMRMLRSKSYGGAGRLEQIRREVLVRSGESVPVNMTAAMIYEGGKEVASVGIFSDLRDRIRIEQRLLQAQEQLQDQEQRSMLAELAGAAAHELNQPLTSIIGYAQLIQRTSELGANSQRYTDTIVQEAERMAEIVKKIGKITHYETVPYVGSTNIVDLSRSIEASEAQPVPALIFSDEEPTGRITLQQIAETQEEEMRAEAEAGMKQSQDDKSDNR